MVTRGVAEADARRGEDAVVVAVEAVVARGDVAHADAVHRPALLLCGAGRAADVGGRVFKQPELLAVEELRVGDHREAVALVVRGVAHEREVVAVVARRDGTEEAHDSLLDGRGVACGRRDEEEAGAVVGREDEAPRGVGHRAAVAVAHDDTLHAAALVAHRARAGPGGRDVGRERLDPAGIARGVEMDAVDGQLRRHAALVRHAAPDVDVDQPAAGGHLAQLLLFFLLPL